MGLVFVVGLSWHNTYRRVKRRNAYQPHKLGWRRFESYLGNQKRGLGRYLFRVGPGKRLTQSAAVSFVVSLKVQYSDATPMFEVINKQTSSGWWRENYGSVGPNQYIRNGLVFAIQRKDVSSQARNAAHGAVCTSATKANFGGNESQIAVVSIRTVRWRVLPIQGSTGCLYILRKVVRFPSDGESYLDWCCNYVKYPSDAYGHKTLQRPTRSIKNQRLLVLRSRDKRGGTKQPHPPNLCNIERYPSGDGTALIRR